MVAYPMKHMTACLACVVWSASCDGRPPAPQSTHAKNQTQAIRTRSAPVLPVRQRLARELEGAYPIEAPPAKVTRSFDLRAAPSTVQLFDGRLLDVWSYNGQVPGPILRVRLGEEVVVRLKNDLPQPTTIHWHGVRVPNAMDGVPGVTQDPIPPGGTFTYRFVPKDAGTFWFHPHVRGAEQVERGLYGVLVVDDVETLPYDHDEVWVLDDWRLGPDGRIDPRFVTRHDLAHDGRWGREVTVNGDASMSWSVRPGSRVRLRLVNTSNGRVYRPDFGALDAQVIAVDGMYTAKPLPLDGFDLAPGNRIDLDLVIPKDATSTTYDVLNRFGRRPTTLATLKVEGKPIETKAFDPPSNPSIPAWREASNQPVDHTYVLGARRGGPHGIEWTINGKAWGDHAATDLKHGRWVRLRFQNDSGRLHPMHIHGQFFKVLARNGKAVEESHLRDTVLVRGRDTVDIGMVPTDWGKWLMHCHILEHAEAGMRTELDVAHDPQSD